MGLREEYEKRNVDATNKQNETERKIRIVSSLPFYDERMTNSEKEFYYDSTLCWKFPSEIQELFNEAPSLINLDKWIKPKRVLTDRDFVDKSDNHIDPPKGSFVYALISARNIYRCRWKDGSEHISYFACSDNAENYASGFFSTAAARALMNAKRKLEKIDKVIQPLLVSSQEYVVLDLDPYTKPILYKDGTCFGCKTGYYKNDVLDLKNYQETKENLLKAIIKINHSQNKATSYPVGHCWSVYDDNFRFVKDGLY